MKEQHESLGRMIAYIHYQGKSFLNRKLAPLGIGSSSIPVLGVLYRHDGISQQELSKLVHVDKAAITRSVKKLLDHGFVQRKRDPEDNRAYQLYITDKARKHAPEIFKALQSWSVLLAQGMNKEEKEAVIRLLKKMWDNASLCK